MTNEQNIQTDVSFEYKNEHVEVFVNGFYNVVNDYIFIEPNGDNIDGNFVFVYQQQDAKLYGGEVGLHFHPHPLDWLHIESSFESVTGKLNNDNYLPLIPANSWTNTLRTEFNNGTSWLPSSYAFATLKSVFEQNNVSEFETTTPSYALFSIGLGGRIFISEQPVDIRLSGNNLFDKDYISHLSRLKVDGIGNIGRNINLGVSLPF